MVIMLAEQGWRGPIAIADPAASIPQRSYMEYFERDFLKPQGSVNTRFTGTHLIYTTKRHGGTANTFRDFA